MLKAILTLGLHSEMFIKQILNTIVKDLLLYLPSCQYSVPGDSFTYHNQYAFSTKDRDNDVTSSRCAQISTGAWWYKSCHHSNLNGVYGSTDSSKGVNWYYWKGFRVSMAGTRMMVKRKN